MRGSLGCIIFGVSDWEIDYVSLLMYLFFLKVLLLEYRGFSGKHFMYKFLDIIKYGCFALSLLLCGCSQSPIPEEELRLSLTKEEISDITETFQHIEGAPLLHCAIQSIRFDIAKKLILQGADVNAEDKQGRTPLFYFGLTQRDPDDYDFDFRSMGEFMIEHGADINHRDHEGNTPLHTTIENSRIAELLILKGVAVNTKSKDGLTPLHWAAYDYRFDRYDRPTKSIKLLLNANVDVNVQDNKGQTPLHYAVKSDNYKACELLLKNGANIDIKDNRGNTPLGIARKEYRFDLMCLLSDTKGNEKVEFINFFKAINHDDISYIKYINKETIDSFIKKYAVSPLILAVMMNKVKVAKFLISRGADVTGECSLPRDYQYFLGDNYVDVEFYGNFGWTLLHIAVSKSMENDDDPEMVKLLANKRTVNIKDIIGRTPLSLAKPNSEISKILIANGAK